MEAGKRRPTHEPRPLTSRTACFLCSSSLTDLADGNGGCRRRPAGSQARGGR